ncbi:hypothetical protein D0Z07_8842 [Hyphodiscus hymeniophilus]|uniref:Uncharacterized protein n=1 Tax=Hyphodiscus hymeniophilus TaxID=353542 RepID=A0A9P6VDL6_9HELO|nr:hypothetical protein D0Z07_8842 [Hyphodiscus hymeniophilus]
MDHAHQNQSSYNAFENEARKDEKVSHDPLIFGGFEWAQGKERHESCAAVNNIIRSPRLSWGWVADHEQSFAPLDLPTSENVKDLLSLYRLYSIPGSFVSERLHNIACSFGTCHEKIEAEYSWFHFLCKNIPVVEVGGVKRIVDQNTAGIERQLSQSDFSWVRSAYCLKTKWTDRSKNRQEVSLIVFGGGPSLWERFDEISSHTSWQAIVEDPYCLYNVIFECLYTQVDRLAWNLAQVYGQEEEKILRSANLPGSAADHLDFVGLHMLSKHEIYLLEGAEAVMATLESLRAYHDQVTKDVTMFPSALETKANFRYRKLLFNSTNLRLKSLEKRTQNMINLSFNLVTQADSRIMKADSSSMKTIAAMTLVFLPCTAVATIFSTPFFYLSSELNEGPIRMSPYFWLIWVIAIPLTLLVMYAWYRYQSRLQQRIVGGAQPMPLQQMV